MTSFKVIEIAATAIFRPMNSNDWACFAGAEPGTVIAEVSGHGRHYIVLQTPAGYFEVHDEEGNCWAFTVEQIVG